MRHYLLATAAFALLVGALAVVARLVPWVAGAGPTPRLVWAFIPPAVPNGAPFAAWFGMDVPPGAAPAGPSASVQLRVCDLEGACLLGARKPVAEGQSTGLVTATRSLAPGEYDLDLLVLRPDRLGGVRTVQVVSQRVKYGD